MNDMYGQYYQTSPYTSSNSPSYLPTPPSPGLDRGAPGVYIEPRSVVYTTTAGRDRQVLYSVFRAEPRSYQSAQGRVDGIQWELVEVTLVQPVNLLPADRIFYAAWGTNGEKERQRMIEKWLYERNAKIGRREDPNLRGPGRYPAAADWERERRAQAQAQAQVLAAEEELALREQERRRRRIGSNPIYGANSGSDYPPYTRTRSESFSRYERADDDLAIAMDKVDFLDRPGYEDQQRRERRRSVSRGCTGVNYRNPSPGRLPNYTNPPLTTTRPRKGSVSGGGGGGSPYMGSQPGLVSLTGGPVYPPGHILAGRPIPGLQSNDMSMGGRSVTNHRSPAPPPGQLGGGGGVITSYRSSSPRPEAMYRAPSPRPDVTGPVYRSSSRSRSRFRAPSPLPHAVSISSPSAFFRPSGNVSFPYTVGIHVGNLTCLVVVS